MDKPVQTAGAKGLLMTAYFYIFIISPVPAVDKSFVPYYDEIVTPHPGCSY